MKKITIVALCILLLATAICTTVFATAGSAELAASVSVAQPGNTVEFVVSVANFPEADSLSVEVTIPDGLTFQSGEWILAGGFLSDYTASMNMGIWGSTSIVDLSAKTDIFKLTCVVDEPAVGQQDLTKEVRIAVSVKADGASKGSLNTSAQVEVSKPATELTLSQQTLQLDLSGTKTAQLTATVNPENTTQTLSWVSGNSGVATVSANGTVTAVAKGETVIKATVGTLEKSCAVTVICGHSQKTQHAAEPSTCQVKGNNLYYICNTCGVALKADGTTETTVQAETLALENHKGGTASCSQKAVCQWCTQPYGDTLPHSYSQQWTSTGTADTDKHYRLCTSCQTAKTEEGQHSFQWDEDLPATEDSTGLKHEECGVCGVKRNENTRIEQLPHQHIGVTRYPAVAATCKTTGTVEYWTCASHKCTGKYYGNAEGTVELASVVTEIDSSNHVHTELRDQLAANCYKPGYTGDTWCLDCTNKVSDGRTIDATGNHTAGAAWHTDANNHWHLCTTDGCTAPVDKAAHSYQWKVDSPATEDVTGLKHEECVCGVKRSEGTVINKLDHKHIGITHHAAVKATCVSTGTVEYWTCASQKCAGKYYSDAACQLEITTLTEPVNAGNHAGLYVVDKVEAACRETGYTGDTWCSKCKVLVKKGEVILATGVHTAAGDYQSDKDGHWNVCACGEHIQEGAHTAQLVNVKEATQTQTGYTGDEVCSVCGYVVKKGEEIPVVTAPETEPTTEATQPSTDDTSADGKKNWIAPVVIVVALAAAALGFVMIKKRNSKN